MGAVGDVGPAQVVELLAPGARGSGEEKQAPGGPRGKVREHGVDLSRSEGVLTSRGRLDLGESQLEVMRYVPLTLPPGPDEAEDLEVIGQRGRRIGARTLQPSTEPSLDGAGVDLDGEQAPKASPLGGESLGRLGVGLESRRLDAGPPLLLRQPQANEVEHGARAVQGSLGGELAVKVSE
jgi:hypothetical protein